MRLSRKTNFFTASAALLSIFFMQLAVAAYACPSAAKDRLPNNNAALHQNMPGCHKMDMQQPALCHAYCESENFSLDKPQLPQVQPFLALTLIDVITTTSPPLSAHPPLFLLERISAPPITIQHCCFRI